MEPGVADGESLSAFADQSLDAVTCTWGLMFMPRWQKAVQARPKNASRGVLPPGPPRGVPPCAYPVCVCIGCTGSLRVEPSVH